MESREEIERAVNEIREYMRRYPDDREIIERVVALVNSLPPDFKHDTYLKISKPPSPSP